jgi:hypothetical protein
VLFSWFPGLADFKTMRAKGDNKSSKDKGPTSFKMDEVMYRDIMNLIETRHTRSVSMLLLFLVTSSQAGSNRL